MPATKTRRPRNTQVQRDENIARVANQHAEAALAHMFHLNGLPVTNDVFDGLQVELREAMREVLHRAELRALIRCADAPEPTRVREPRTIPAVVTNW